MGEAGRLIRRRRLSLLFLSVCPTTAAAAENGMGDALLGKVRTGKGEMGKLDMTTVLES